MVWAREAGFDRKAKCFSNLPETASFYEKRPSKLQRLPGCNMEACQFRNKHFQTVFD